MSRRLAPGPGIREAVRGNVLAVSAVSLLVDLSSEMVNPLLPVFVAGLVPAAAAPVVLGMMEGLAEAAASLLKLVSGRMSDRLGRRKALMLVGYALSTLSRPLMSLASAGWHAVGLKLVDRVGKGIRTSPRDALIADAVPPERRGLAFSFHRAMDHTGAVLGPLLALAVLQWTLGYTFWRGDPAFAAAQEMAALRLVFALSLVPGLVALAVIVVAVREVAPPPRAEVKAKEAAPAPTRLPRRFHAFVAASALFALGNSSDLFLLLYAHEKFGYGAGGLIFLWVALHGVKAGSSVPGGLLADRFGRRPALLAGWAIYAAVYLGLAFADAGWQLWALLLLYGLYIGLTEGAAKAMVADYTPADRRGAAFGVFHAAVGLAALPASLLFGVFWATLGARAAFSIGAALAVAAALVLLASGKPPPAVKE